MTDNELQLITLGVVMVMNLIVMIMAFFVYRSVPQAAIQQILDAAEKAAARTSTGLDDEAVKIAKSLAILLQSQTPAAIDKPEVVAQDVKKK